LIMTRRVFKDHTCAVAAAGVARNAPAVIDLTFDDEEIAHHRPTFIDLTADDSD
jgi:hypothetical protein